MRLAIRCREGELQNITTTTQTSEAVIEETLNRAPFWSDRWSLTINLLESTFPCCLGGCWNCFTFGIYSLFKSFTFPNTPTKCSASTSLTGSHVYMSMRRDPQFFSFQPCLLSLAHHPGARLRLTIRSTYARFDVKILYLHPGYQRGVIVSGTWQPQNLRSFNCRNFQAGLSASTHVLERKFGFRISLTR